MFAGARGTRLTYSRGAGWFDNLKGEEFRSLYQARPRQSVQRAPRARAPWSSRATSDPARRAALTRRALQSGFMRVLRGRDRAGRRVSILLPARFPDAVDANTLMRCAQLRHGSAPRLRHAS